LRRGKPKLSIEIGVRDLPIQTLSEGDVGIEGFYTGDPRDHWARVVLSVLVYQLPRTALLDNMKLVTEVEQEKLFLTFENVYTRMCYVCKMQGHHFKTCPYVTYQPDRKLLLECYLETEG
jgi:hypothetical protein